jgi:GGDEF domain-containing protein
VLSLEGLRGLDDRGLWQQRDALVENVARLVCSRLRSDDVAGRFSDDRFMLLLRRLDSGLGRLIIEKLVSAIDEFLAGRTCGVAPAPIRVRAGLAGSGQRQVSLSTLLVSAIEAADLARRQDRSVCSDLESTAGAQPGDGAGRGAQTALAGGPER